MTDLPAPSTHDVWRFCTTLPGVRSFSCATEESPDGPVFVVGLKMKPGTQFADVQAVILAAFPAVPMRVVDAGQ